MKKTYEIESYRHDIPRHVIDCFTIEADTVEECDKKAIERFEPKVLSDCHSWDYLELKRVDVERVVTSVISGGRLQELKKRNLPYDFPGVLSP